MFYAISDELIILPLSSSTFSSHLKFGYRIIFVNKQPLYL